jgi:hypothetical protein
MDGGIANCPLSPFPFRIAAGPTGDVAVGMTCAVNFQHGYAAYKRLNGAGTFLAGGSFDPNPSSYTDVDATVDDLSIGPTNDLYLKVGNICQGSSAPPSCPSGSSQWIAPDGTIISPPTWQSPLGTLATATATTATDLGCGSLPAAPGGSTFITRKDTMGNCLYARALPVPGLQATMDSTGRVIVSGYAGTSTVDLGSGPLAPIGAQDMVVGELDVAGNPLWSRRIGAAGVLLIAPNGPFGSPANVSASAAGDVYVLTYFNVAGAVDFGGGAVSAGQEMPVVASYSATGAFRWSRSYSFPWKLAATIDGCGSLLIATAYVANQACKPASAPFALAPAVMRFAP